MADTIRNRSAALALLPDNTSGEISPQDIRDFLVSTWGVYGSMAVQNSATIQNVDTTPIKLTAWTIDNGGVGVTTDLINDQMSYDTTGVFLVFMSLTCGGMNPLTKYTFSLALDGSAISGAITSITPTDANDFLNASIVFPVSVASVSSILSVLVSSDDAGGQDVNVQHGQLVTYRIF